MKTLVSMATLSAPSTPNASQRRCVLGAHRRKLVTEVYFGAGGVRVETYTPLSHQTLLCPATRVCTDPHVG